MSWILLGLSLFVIARVIYRLYPVFRGRVSAQTDLETRVARWNRYALPHIKRYLETQLNIAAISIFRSARSGTQLSIATWALTPTLVSEVDFIAITDPASLDASPTIYGFVRADLLRDALGGALQGNPILGHRVWTYVWPFNDDVSVLSSILVTTEKFMHDHGLAQKPTVEGS